MKTIFIVLLNLSFNIYAIEQTDDSYVINKTIQTNCKGLSHYTLPNGHTVNCLTDQYIETYSFAKDYQKTLNSIINIASTTEIDRTHHIVWICAKLDECDNAVKKINIFTAKNNLKSIQMSAVVVPWL